MSELANWSPAVHGRCRRDMQEPQERSQREALAGPIHGAQDWQLVAYVRQTRYSEAKPGRLQQGQREPQQCRELPHAWPQLEHFCRSSGSGSSVTPRQTTVGVLPSHPRAVERGTPRSVGTSHLPSALD